MTSKTDSTPTAPAEAGDCERSSLAHGSAPSPFFTNLRAHWRNWWNRGTANAYKKLTKAMRDDPSYALSWQCNIAMPIYDGVNGKLSHAEANAIADTLMKHLFDVPNPEVSHAEPQTFDLATNANGVGSGDLLGDLKL